ncbi:MAG: hypothetical protein ACE14M_15680 [Terriglobales bacterium]
MAITLSEFVLAEIVLNPQASAIFSTLNQFPLRWGMSVADTLERVAALGATEIVSFTPFMPDGKCTLKNVLAGGPCADHIREAQRIKDKNRAFGGAMFDKAKVFRQRITSQAAKRKFATIEEAITCLPSFQSMVADWISNGSTRQVQVSDPQKLYEVAIGNNQHLRRLFLSILYHLLAWSRAWSNQKWNFDPSSTRDDWADMTLPLYAEDGDVILTADNKLRTALQVIEPSGAVTVQA